MKLRGAGCTIAIALVASIAAPLSASSAKGASCGPARARTLASSEQARVYALGSVVYGCTEAAQYRLGRLRICNSAACVHPVVVAGVLAAYGRERYGTDTSSSEVVVRSLADGKQLSVDPAITGGHQAEAYQSVGSLVAKPDGDVAWIAESRSILGGPVRIQVRSGRTVLDSGATIDPHSLELHGSLLSWKHGSTTRTARLR